MPNNTDFMNKRIENLNRMIPHIKYLENEWSFYKYAVLERNPVIYQEIRQLLKNKNQYPVIAFYQLIDSALQSKLVLGHVINACEHVYGYFKKIASEGEKNEFNQLILKVIQDISTLGLIKKFLYDLSVKYEQKYLMNSYYFFEDENIINGGKI